MHPPKTHPEIAPAIARKIAARASRADEAIVVGTRGGMIEWANEAWTKVTGFAVDDAIAKPIGGLLAAADIEPTVVDFVQRKFLAGKRCELELPLTTPDGRRRWIHLDVEPFRDTLDEVTDFVAVATDITVRREGEFELESRIQRALAESAEILDDAAETKSDGGGPIPLESLAAFDALARVAAMTHCDDDAAIGTLRRVKAIAAETIANEYGAAPTPRLIDLASLVRQACSERAHTFGDATELDADLSAELPAVHAAEAPLRTLTGDLVEQAARVIGDEWGTVSVTTGIAPPGEALPSPVHPSVDRWTLELDHPHVFVEIHDTALSLGHEALRFVERRTHPLPRDPRSLSLALAASRAEALGGALRVHSMPGIGTRLVLYVPLGTEVG